MQHIVGHTKSQDYSPELSLYDSALETFSSIPLPSGAQIALPLSSQKICIGYDDVEGAYHPCALATKLRSGQQCRYCQADDALLPCLKCDGSVCLALSQVRQKCKEHQMVIYLAGFADKVKAGVSQVHRIERRLIEQGADFAVPLFKLTDGKEARRYEALLVKRGLYNFLTGRQKINLLQFDKSVAFDRFQSTVQQFNEDPVFSHLERYAPSPDVRDYTSRYPQLSNPPVATESLNGNVLGSKGSLLFLEQNGSVNVLELNKLIGLHVESAQGTLGAF